MNLRATYKSYLAKIPPESRLAVAVSGGVDSVLLATTLLEYCREFEPQRQIFVLHLNHNTRGEETDLEQKFVQDLCKKWEVPCFSEKLKKIPKPTQSKLRNLRKSFFAKHLKLSDYLFLAHHQDDQAETILLRLFRGVGVRGLRGMKDFDPPVVRPLLQISKAEILREANARKLIWIEDSSNLSVKYERNWIRLELLPSLEKRRPGVKKRLAALALEAASLKLPKMPKPVLRSDNGWKLYSLHGKSWQHTSVLSSLFSLDRSLAARLKDRIQAGSGKLEYRGRVYWVSCGYLLVGAENWKSTHSKERNFHSEFGVWNSDSPLFSRAELPGDKVKKLFQEKRIPLFFRDSVPLVKKNGRWEILFKANHPTEAGNWFNGAFQSRDSRGRAVSKEKPPTQ